MLLQSLPVRTHSWYMRRCASRPPNHALTDSLLHAHLTSSCHLLVCLLGLHSLNPVKSPNISEHIANKETLRSAIISTAMSHSCCCLAKTHSIFMFIVSSSDDGAIGAKWRATVELKCHRHLMNLFIEARSEQLRWRLLMSLEAVECCYGRIPDFRFVEWWSDRWNFKRFVGLQKVGEGRGRVGGGQWQMEQKSSHWKMCFYENFVLNVMWMRSVLCKEHLKMSYHLEGFPELVLNRTVTSLLCWHFHRNQWQS